MSTDNIQWVHTDDLPPLHDTRFTCCDHASLGPVVVRDCSLRPTYVLVVEGGGFIVRATTCEAHYDEHVAEATTIANIIAQIADRTTVTAHYVGTNGFVVL